MGKLFIDKILLENFVKHKQKVIAIFLNDIQRKEATKVSYTFVSGVFLVYSQFLVQLDGAYYIDPPKKVLEKPYSDTIKPFSELITKDIYKLFPS